MTPNLGGYAAVINAHAARAAPLRPRIVNLERIWMAAVGQSVDAEQVLERTKRIELNRRLDNLIARKLEAVGHDPWQLIGEDTVADLPLDGSQPLVITRPGDRIVRRWNIFPSQQARTGAEARKRLLLFFDGLGPAAKHVHMWVVSAGWLELHELALGIRKLHRLVRDAAKILQTHGLQLAFEKIEGPLIRDAVGRVYVNLHSHLLVQHSRYLAESEWADLLSSLRAAARRHVNKDYVHHDGPVGHGRRPIEKAINELVKYMTKGTAAPGEEAERASGARAIGLEELDQIETEALHECTFRRNFLVPHGQARQLWRLIDDGQTVEHIDPDTGEITERLETYRVVRDEEGYALQPRWPHELRPEYSDRQGKRRAENIVLGPSLRVVEVAPGRHEVRGCLRVMNPAGDLTRILEQRNLGWLKELHDRCLAARAATIIQDTTTVKLVQAGPAEGQTGPPAAANVA